MLEDRTKLAQQIPSELERLKAIIAAVAPKVIVEIGSAQGGTLAHWMQVPGVEYVISIDEPDGVYGGVSVAERSALCNDCSDYSISNGFLFTGISENSRVAVDYLEPLLRGRRIDFLFIDGDHRYEGVKSDFELYAPFVRDGGLIAFHDIVDSEQHKNVGVDVARFWRELKSEHLSNTEEIIADPNQTWAGIGVLYK